MDAAKFARLKARHDTILQNKNRAEGALAQIIDQLKTEFSVRDLTAGKAMLPKIEAEANHLEKEADRLATAFEEKLGGRLDG